MRTEVHFASCWEMNVFQVLRHLSIKNDESDRTHIISYICFSSSQLFDSSKLLYCAWAGVYLFSVLLSHPCHSHFSHCPPLSVLSLPIYFTHTLVFFLSFIFFSGPLHLTGNRKREFQNLKCEHIHLILLLLGFLFKAVIVCLKPLEMHFQKSITYGGR